MIIQIPFISAGISADENLLTVSLSVTDLQWLAESLVTQNHLTVSMLIEIIISQLKYCDRTNLMHVLPENMMAKLNDIYAEVSREV